MYPASFDYYRPKTVAEATDLLRTHKDAKVLAGGHSLLPVLKLRLASPPALIDIGGIRDLAGVRASGGTLRIGALTTHATLADSKEVKASCPVLSETALAIGDLQVRNRGTIGGSLAHADPAADFPTLMVALGATITAVGPGGQRDIPAEEFFKDLFTTALKPGELLTAITVPTYGAGTGGAYLKHRHPASSYAVVGVAALVTASGGRVSRASVVVGGATAKPVRVTGAERALSGQPADDATLGRAAAAVTGAITDPLSDIYASGDYRIHLATVMARRALALATERARG